MSSNVTSTSAVNTTAVTPNATLGSTGNVIQVLSTEYKLILSELNPKKFPQIKDVTHFHNTYTRTSDLYITHIYTHTYAHTLLTTVVTFNTLLFFF